MHPLLAQVGYGRGTVEAGQIARPLLLVGQVRLGGSGYRGFQPSAWGINQPLGVGEAPAGGSAPWTLSDPAIGGSDGTNQPSLVYRERMESTLSEAQAVREARSGDTAAYAVLVALHQEVAFRAAYLVVRDAGAAEDVVQEGFVRAYRAGAASGTASRFDPGFCASSPTWR